MKTLAIHFARFGPYHLARIEAARAVLAPLGWEVIGLETGGGDATYAWREEKASQKWRRVTVFPGEAAEAIEKGRLKAGMTKALEEIKPDAVAVAGWGSADARACQAWCRTSGAMAIVMSETREADGTRVWWKEWLKRRIVSRFDAGLVGTKSHREYLAKLGVPQDRVALGYNVVGNGYFAEECRKVRKSKVEGQEPARFFLASNRFIPRKNLARLIEAYADYAKRGSSPTTAHRPPTTGLWSLCLLGDGEEREALLALCEEVKLHVEMCAPWEKEGNFECSILNCECELPTVYFPGFRQIDELPRFYAHAGCFVHPAMEEPWGLVLNEAMASGLPIVSGKNVGAAEELVDDGVNGWTFDAENMDEMAECLTKVAGLDVAGWQAMADASERILEERCPTHAFGEGLGDLLRGRFE
ncbi:MAG: glycosyltransferase family 4 protein [Verrucomicrobiales bacterium]